MDIWIELQRAAREHNCKPITTSLLGRVPYKKTPSGEFTGCIPDDLQETAANYGLVIDGALWKDDQYVLRMVTPNAQN